MSAPVVVAQGDDFNGAPWRVTRHTEFPEVVIAVGTDTALFDAGNEASRANLAALRDALTAVLDATEPAPEPAVPCFVCGGYGEQPPDGHPHRWQDCPRLGLPEAYAGSDAQ